MFRRQSNKPRLLRRFHSRFRRRLIYGGHIISLARALSVNGLANACLIAAINGGRHVAPCFAGDTVFAWTQVLDKAELDGRRDLGALRLRTIATKDRPCDDFPGETVALREVLGLDRYRIERSPIGSTPSYVIVD